MQKEINSNDKIEAFRLATGANDPKWAEFAETGLSDEELVVFLAEKLGTFGGRGGPEQLHISHQGAGLKIWVSWKVHNHCQMTPTFQGKATLDMARKVYGISNPNEPQLSLFS